MISWCDLIIQRGLSWCPGNVGPSGLVQYVDSFIRGTTQRSLSLALSKTGCCTKGHGEHKADNMLASRLACLFYPTPGHHLIRSSRASRHRLDTFGIQKETRREQRRSTRCTYLRHLHAIPQHPSVESSCRAATLISHQSRGPWVSDLEKPTLHGQVVLFLYLRG